MVKFMVLLAAAAIGVWPLSATAQEPGPGTDISSNGILNPRAICNAIDNQLMQNPRTARHPDIRFIFENLFADAAHVAPTDTREQVHAKIRFFINDNMPRLKCNGSYNGADGNILKLAVLRQFDELIDRALGKWKIDVNQVDEEDGKTVLDYIADLRARSPSDTTLSRYYDDFRAAGGKHRAELEREGKVVSLAIEQANNLSQLEGKARAGDTEAALRLYRAYAYGRDTDLAVAVDLNQARPWLDFAGSSALAGRNATDLYSVGMTYDDRQMQDPASSAAWLQRAASAGSAEARFWLGRYYATGHGVPRDLNRALQLMTVAEAAGERTAALWMGSIHGWMGHREEQIRWYRYATASGLSAFDVPGFEGSLADWFQANGANACGPDIKGGKSC